MIGEILNWFNHQWLLTTFLVFFGVFGIPSALYTMWDDKRIRREANR